MECLSDIDIFDIISKIDGRFEVDKVGTWIYCFFDRDGLSIIGDNFNDGHGGGLSPKKM
jgi:hypothetical protein